MTSLEEKLSTTALARKLEIPAQEVFGILKDYGWIERKQSAWALTAKGEYEGGSYQKSKKYGAYIVWPHSLLQHPLLLAIESSQRLTAATLCRHYSHFNTRQMNRVLAELGLQKHTIMGWEITEHGGKLGGLQEESTSTGGLYVTWPNELMDNPVVHRELNRQGGQVDVTADESDAERDLFAAPADHFSTCKGIDGHILASALQTRVCDWLYLAQLVHAVQRNLPVEEELCADFYVPSGQVYIDCWEADVPAEQLSGKLRKRELYRELELRSLEINADDAGRLDEVLGRGLLSFGVRH